MNINLLREVQKTMLERPTQVNMSDWFTLHNSHGEKIENCGTAGCIAGWALHLDSKDKTLVQTQKRIDFRPVDDLASIHSLASKILELNSLQANRLFYVADWPESFAELYVDSKNQKELAQVVVDRIEHFIKTEGAE